LNFPLRPVAALTGSLISLCVGTSYAKGLFPALGPAGTTTYRLLFASLLMLAVMRPWNRRWSLSDLPLLGLFGAALGLMNLLFYSALKTIPLSLAIALEFSGPLAVALWGARRPVDWLWIALALTGLLLLLPLPGRDQAAALDPVGVAFALAGGTCWAGYIIFGQKAAQRHGQMAAPMGLAIAAVIVAPAGMLQAGTALLDPSLLLLGLGVGLLASAIPYSLEVYALARLPKPVFSMLLSMEPAVGAMAGWIILSEQLSLLQLLAVACVISAAMGSAWVAGQSQDGRS
jgi:inner membrane transporter RhtA